MIRPHGIKGEVRATAFAAGAPNLQAGQAVLVAGHAMRVLSIRPDKGQWVLKLDLLRDRDTVERFRGHLIEVEDAAIVRADAESYFVRELIGLRVVTAGGRELGTLTEVLQPGANDVYVVKDRSGRERLIPAIGEVIAVIDLPVGVMTITPMAGLLDEAE